MSLHVNHCKSSYFGSKHLKHRCIYFSIQLEFHHPNWRTHSFQRGRYTINQQFWFDVYLVGGFQHLDYFPFHIWNVILPIDELIFFKMVIAPPTRLASVFPVFNNIHFPNWLIFFRGVGVPPTSNSDMMYIWLVVSNIWSIFRFIYGM